jgi:hypothetical protein
MNAVRVGIARFGVMNLASVALVILTAARMFLLCLSHPIAGYANNYDFLRQSSCVGVWQVYEDREKTAPHPDRPVNALVHDGDRRSGLCMQSSDNLFPWAAGRLSGKNAHFGLRRVGVLKAIVALAAMIGLLLQPISSSLRLSLAVVATLIYGDFSLMLFLNTLYLDWSLLIFIVASIGLAVAAFCRRTVPGPISLAFFIGSLAWFCFARQQYWPFSIVIGLTAALAVLLRWRDWRRALVLCVATIAIQLAYVDVQLHMSEHTQNIDKANRVDTFLSATLPAAHDPVAAMAVAGLPQHCAGAIGKDWYTPGFQQEKPCTEVYSLSRLRLLKLFVFDPNMLLAPMMHALAISRPALLQYVGHFERPADVAGRRYRWLNSTSMSTLIADLPYGLYRILAILSFLVGPIALGAALFRGIRLREHSGDDFGGAMLMAGLGGLLGFYGLFSSVYGDGYGDMPRHAIGLLLGIDLQVGAWLLVVLNLLSRARARERHRQMLSLSYASGTERIRY